MSNITSFRGGPAWAAWNALNLVLREDWKVTNPEQYFDIPSATGVGVTKGVSDKLGKVSAVPKIFVSQLAAQIAAFFPYTSNLNNGALIRPAADLPMIINARFGGAGN